MVNNEVTDICLYCSYLIICISLPCQNNLNKLDFSLAKYLLLYISCSIKLAFLSAGVKTERCTFLY